MKDVLIVGASGFIGSYLFQYCKDKNINVLGTKYSNKYNTFIDFDMMHDEISKKLPKEYTYKKNNKVAIICSSNSRIDDCFVNREKSYLLNVVKTKELINKLKELNFKIVYLSSDNVFDGKKGCYNENSPVSPINEYGKQKVAIENYILQNSQDDLIIRLSKNISSKYKDNQLFTEWYNACKQNKTIYSIENNFFSPTLVDDVVKGIILAIDKNLNGIYHLSNDEFFNRHHLVKYFFNILNIDYNNIYEKQLNEFCFKDKRPLNTCLNNYKFRTNTNFRFTPIADVIRAFIKSIF